MSQSDIDRFDRLIDMLNSGESPARNDDADGELASLIDTLRAVQHLTEPERPTSDFPQVLATRLARELQADPVPSNPAAEQSTAGATASTNGYGDSVGITSPHEGNALIVQTSRRRWLRHGLELVAAAVALAVVTALLAALFSDRDQAHEPAPGSNGATLLTLEEARQRLPFSLVVPEPARVPPSLSFTDVDVQVPPDGSDSPAWARLVYLARENPSEAVNITETTAPVTTPDARQMQAALLRSAPAPAVPLPEPSQTTVMLGGREVLKTMIYTPEGKPLLTYSWDHDGVHIDVSGIVGGAITEAHVEQLVSATAEQATSPRDLAPMPSPDREAGLLGSEGSPATLEDAKERVRAFLGEPDVELEGELIDPRAAIPGRNIVPGPGLVSAPVTFELTRQVANLRYADHFVVDAATGEVIGANLPSNTTLIQPRRPVSEAQARAIAEAVAQRTFAGFDELTFHEAEAIGMAPGADDGDALYSAVWQKRAGESGAWLPTWVRVSIDLETGQLFLYAAMRGDYQGSTEPRISQEQAIQIALAEAQKDPNLAAATAAQVELTTAAPDGTFRLVWFIFLEGVPDGARVRFFHVDALSGEILNPIGSPAG